MDACMHQSGHEYLIKYQSIIIIVIIICIIIIVVVIIVIVVIFAVVVVNILVHVGQQLQQKWKNSLKVLPLHFICVGIERKNYLFWLF